MVSRQTLLAVSPSKHAGHLGRGGYSSIKSRSGLASKPAGPGSFRASTRLQSHAQSSGISLEPVEAIIEEPSLYKSGITSSRCDE